MANGHPPAPARDPAGTFAALRHRNFRLLWVSLLVSNSGTWLQGVAQDYLVYQLTGRALDLGAVSLARAVAIISLSFLGGTIADRLDRRRLLMVTQTLFALLAAALGLLVQTGAVRVWHVVVAAFAGAVILAVDQPARQSLLPHLVPRQDLMNAIALNSITFTGAAAIGPALAGPVVAAFGIPWGFYLNALSFAAVIGAVWAIRLPPAPRRPGGESIRAAVASGLRYIGASRPLLLLVSLLMVVSFFAMPYQSLLPVLNHRVFDGGVGELGWLRAAPGLGALAGGLVLAYLSQAIRRRGLLLLAGAAGFSAVLLAASATGWFPLTLLLLFLAGLFFTLFQSTTQTLMQQLTDDAMRGRVMSLFAVSVIGTWPLGSLPMAWLADRAGVTAALAVGAGIAGTFTLAIWLGTRRVRAL